MSAFIISPSQLPIERDWMPCMGALPAGLELLWNSPGALGQGAEDPFYRARAERDTDRIRLRPAARRASPLAWTKTPPDPPRGRPVRRDRAALLPALVLDAHTLLSRSFTLSRATIGWTELRNCGHRTRDEPKDAGERRFACHRRRYAISRRESARDLRAHTVSKRPLWVNSCPLAGGPSRPLLRAKRPKRRCSGHAEPDSSIPVHSA
jgi:hypothetical protein